MSDDAKVAAAMGEISSLSSQIAKAQASKRDQSLASAAKATISSTNNKLASIRSLRSRRTLRGHFGKVTASHWSGDSTYVVSASQDGNLLVWNAVTANKVQAIALKSAYVMAVGMEQTKGNLIGCGGLDNLCTVYNRSSPNHPVEMSSHDGFLSCCRFLNGGKDILTSSGDSTCIHWDVSKGLPISRFNGHLSDVMFLSIQPNSDNNVFASCSVDKTVKLWDVRAPKTSTQTLVGHLGDVNGVEFFPCESNCLASCSQDGTVRVWDTRVANELARFGNPVAPSPTMVEDEGFTSLAVSSSGRVIVCGHSDGSMHLFDSLSEKTNGPATIMNGAHDRHVSCVGISPDGNAICSGGWDSVLKIWA